MAVGPGIVVELPGIVVRVPAGLGPLDVAAIEADVAVDDRDRHEPERYGRAVKGGLSLDHSFARPPGPTASRAGVFREGRDTPDLSCQIEIGAATTVKEPFNSKITFGKYVDLTTVAFNREAAE